MLIVSKQKMDTFYQIPILLHNTKCNDFGIYLFVLKLSTLDRHTAANSGATRSTLRTSQTILFTKCLEF